MNNSIITRICHSRGFGLVVAFLAATMAAIYFFSGHTVALTGDTGLGLPSANEWFAHSPALSFVLALLANGITVVVMLLLNKIFNVFRSMTSLFIAFFAMMQLATPDLMTQFCTGNMLAVVVPVCMLLLFSCYRQPEATRPVYLIALLLSAFTTTQYCYALYLLPFLIGCGQMGIFHRRTILAALMGIATPWIIIISFGIIDIDSLQWPRFTSIFSEIDLDETLLLAITIGVTVFLTLLSYILTVLKTIAYNARARAVNGCFTVVMLTTFLGLCLDYRNIVSYIPMLNYCAAMEVTHYFSTHRADKSYILILSTIAVYAALFVCQTVI